MQLNDAGFWKASKLPVLLKQVLCWLLMMSVLLSCKQNTAQQGIIPKEEMTALLTDIHLTDGLLSTSASDSLVKQQAANYFNAVYRKHDTDSVQYRKSLLYYSRRPELMDTMYYQVVKNLEALSEEQEKLETRKRQYEADLDAMRKDTTTWPFLIMPRNRGIYNISGKIRTAPLKKVKADSTIQTPDTLKKPVLKPKRNNPRLPSLKSKLKLKDTTR